MTPQQQANLEDLIISEVANYWRSWRLLQVKKETNLLPEIERLLIKLTGGNPEQAPALIPAKENEELGVSKYLPNSQKALAFIDEVVANLESNTLVPIQQRSRDIIQVTLVPIQQRSRDIIQVTQTQFSIFLYGKEQLAARGQITGKADGLETQPLNIPALIEAAINYFFGVGNVKKINTRETDTKLPGTRLPLSSNRQLKREILTSDSWLTWGDLYGDAETEWLTWGDLYGDAETEEEQPVTSSSRINPPISSSLSIVPSASKNWLKKSQNFLQSTKLNAGLVKKKKSSHNLTSTQKKTSKITSDKSTNSRVSKPKSTIQKGELFPKYQNTQLEAKPDWIETKATLVGSNQIG